MTIDVLGPVKKCEHCDLAKAIFTGKSRGYLMELQEVMRFCERCEYRSAFFLKQRKNRYKESKYRRLEDKGSKVHNVHDRYEKMIMAKKLWIMTLYGYPFGLPTELGQLFLELPTLTTTSTIAIFSTKQKTDFLGR